MALIKKHIPCPPGLIDSNYLNMSKPVTLSNGAVTYFPHFGIKRATPKFVPSSEQDKGRPLMLAAAAVDDDPGVSLSAASSASPPLAEGLKGDKKPASKVLSDAELQAYATGGAWGSGSRSIGSGSGSRVVGGSGSSGSCIQVGVAPRPLRVDRNFEANLRTSEYARMHGISVSSLPSSNNIIGIGDSSISYCREVVINLEEEEEEIDQF